MTEKWYDDLHEDALAADIDIAYEKAFRKIREGLDSGIDFDSACEAIEVDDKELKKVIINDMLKVLIAEEHFAKKIPLEELAKKLMISLDRIKTAKREMFEDVEKNAIDAFYDERGFAGNA